MAEGNSIKSAVLKNSTLKTGRTGKHILRTKTDFETIMSRHNFYTRWLHAAVSNEGEFTKVGVTLLMGMKKISCDN